MKLNAHIPEGLLSEKWSQHKFNLNLVNPANKRKYTVIVVGTGLAGASTAASMAELGYKVLAFSFHESPRRASNFVTNKVVKGAVRIKLGLQDKLDSL